MRMQSKQNIWVLCAGDIALAIIVVKSKKSQKMSHLMSHRYIAYLFWLKES